MVKLETDRKNFLVKTINDVFEEQGRCCSKCGNSITGGFEAHHRDGDRSNNAKENCQLLCAGCHDAELYKTLQDQKKGVIDQVDALITKGAAGEMAGAIIDKLLDAIKLKLSLQRQVYETKLLQPPISAMIESSIVIEEAKIREYANGVKSGMLSGAGISLTILQAMMKKIEGRKNGKQDED